MTGGYRAGVAGAEPWIPEGRLSLSKLRAAAGGCQGCELYACATQVVFGEGPRHAGLMLIGEQPGDQEDRQGRVFVGPAGRVLDAALDAAGLRREQLFLTNAVKHFRWKPAARGKRRLHQRPTRTEAVACRPWLEAEVRVIRPRVLVCLGVVAVEAAIGPRWRIGEHHGEVVTSALGPPAVATVHPSAVLRAPDGAERAALRARLVEDLVVAAHLAEGAPQAPGRGRS